MDARLLLFVFFMLNENKNKSEKKSNNINSLKSLGDFLNSMEIEPNYTKEKIRILKKVGPYFPKEYIGLLNRSILYTERITKLNELIEFMKDDDYKYIQTPIEVSNNKDRISKILDTVKKESPDIVDDNLGIVMDLIINTDKYKKILNLFTTMMKDSNSIKDPTKLISALGPLFGEGEKNKDKMKEMSKMMEIVSLLNTPKKEKSEENKNIEILEDHLKNK